MDMRGKRLLRKVIRRKWLLGKQIKMGVDVRPIIRYRIRTLRIRGGLYKVQQSHIRDIVNINFSLENDDKRFAVELDGKD
jgi:hypothetical protein